MRVRTILIVWVGSERVFVLLGVPNFWFWVVSFCVFFLLQFDDTF